MLLKKSHFMDLIDFHYDTKSPCSTFQKAHLKTTQESQKEKYSNPKIPPLQSAFLTETQPQKCLSQLQLQTFFWKNLRPAFHKTCSNAH